MSGKKKIGNHLVGYNCNPHDLIIVREGIQCSKCLELITRHKPVDFIDAQDRITKLESFGFKFEPVLSALEKEEW